MPLSRDISLIDRVTTIIFGVGGIVFLCIAVYVVEQIYNISFAKFGILPRDVGSLIGIVCSPFIHINEFHLEMNISGIIVLGTLVALHGRYIFVFATSIIMVLGGLAVWLCASSYYHIGASGIIFGYIGFLLLRGWYIKKFVPAVISLLVAIYFGGALVGVFPGDPDMSWEAHLFGFIAGVLAAKWQVEEQVEEQKGG